MIHAISYLTRIEFCCLLNDRHQIEMIGPLGMGHADHAVHGIRPRSQRELLIQRNFEWNRRFQRYLPKPRAHCIGSDEASGDHNR